MSRPLRNSPVWRPMWLLWALGIPAAIVVDLTTKSWWGGLCMLPYLVLAVQVFIYGTRRSDGGR